MNRKQIIVMLTILAVTFGLIAVSALGFVVFADDREAGVSVATFSSLMLLTVVVRELALKLPES